jgi:DNA-binding transcriptional ArsR family regulator
MRAKREYRDRDEVSVSVLDALVERGEEGMTIFELRSHVDATIEEIEPALTELKDDDLIDVDRSGNQTLLKPDPRVIPDDPEDEEPSLMDAIRDRLPF